MSVAKEQAEIESEFLSEHVAGSSESLWIHRLRRAQVPANLHDGLVKYLVHHQAPGRFLLAVLTNDLRGAFGYADEVSRAHLHHLITFLIWDTSPICWGDKAKVHGWLTQESGS